LRILQETQAEEISNKFSNLKKEEKNRAKKIQDVEKTIQTLQADLEKPVEVENMADVDDEIVRLFTSYICIFPTLEQRRLNQGHSRTNERQFDLKEQQRRLVEDESRAKAEIAEGERAYAVFCFPIFAHLRHFLPIQIEAA
jgi:hypothetical protein